MSTNDAKVGAGDRSTEGMPACSVSQAGNEGRIAPSEVLPGDLHCRRCGAYASWGQSKSTNKSVSRGFVQAWWQKRRMAASAAGWPGFVLCTACEQALPLEAAQSAAQAGNEGGMNPAEVHPGSHHCKHCGAYASWRQGQDAEVASEDVSSEFVEEWWGEREDAAKAAGLPGHVLCSTCERERLTLLGRHEHSSPRP